MAVKAKEDQEQREMKTEFWNGYAIRFTKNESGGWAALTVDMLNAIAYMHVSLVNFLKEGCQNQPQEKPANEGKSSRPGTRSRKRKE